MSERSNTITVMEDATGALTWITYRGPSVEDAVAELASARERLSRRGGLLTMFVTDKDQGTMTSLLFEQFEGESK